MPARPNTTTTANFTVNPREIDFVTRFERNFEALREILGITRPIRKEPGAVLRALRGVMTLQPGNVGEGEEIPYSLASVEQLPIAEATIEKYSKGVSMESINNYGYDVAVARTDDAFLNELQGKVSDRMYAFLRSGELTSVQPTFQMGVAMARGYVLNQFKAMRKAVTSVVGFVNLIDFYTYLGSAEITVQQAFGLDYIRDFMGYSVIFLASDEELPRGTIVATPVENMVAYYVDPSSSAFARADLKFTTWGDTPLLGYHTEGNYRTMVSDSYAVMGLSLFAEYINGIAVITIVTGGSLGSLTVTSAAGTESGDTAITVTGAAGTAGNALRYQIGAAASTPAYLADVSTWATWDGTSDITAASGQVITVVEANGSGQALASGYATVVAAE